MSDSESEDELNSCSALRRKVARLEADLEESLEQNVTLAKELRVAKEEKQHIVNKSNTIEIQNSELKVRLIELTAAKATTTTTTSAPGSFAQLACDGYTESLSTSVHEKSDTINHLRQRVEELDSKYKKALQHNESLQCRLSDLEATDKENLRLLASSREALAFERQKDAALQNQIDDLQAEIIAAHAMGHPMASVDGALPSLADEVDEAQDLFVDMGGPDILEENVRLQEQLMQERNRVEAEQQRNIDLQERCDHLDANLRELGNLSVNNEERRDFNEKVLTLTQDNSALEAKLQQMQLACEEELRRKAVQIQKAEEQAAQERLNGKETQQREEQQLQEHCEQLQTELRESLERPYVQDKSGNSEQLLKQQVQTLRAEKFALDAELQRVRIALDDARKSASDAMIELDKLREPALNVQEDEGRDAEDDPLPRRRRECEEVRAQLLEAEQSLKDANSAAHKSTEVSFRLLELNDTLQREFNRMRDNILCGT